MVCGPSEGMAYAQGPCGTSPDTVWALLAGGAEDAPALGAPGRTVLRYGALRALARRSVAALNAVGIGRGDRVAMVLPNGPEMAAAFLAIACGATAAPLNPAYRRDEFDFYLADLGARALVILAGMDSPARQAAAARGIPLIELTPGDDGAGDFRLLPGTNPPRPPAQDGFATADDIALVLHTSGTTARPKIVPLTQANVTVSAANGAVSLALTAEDVCLNVMPLFHIHGLIGAALATMASGGCLWCTPGFNAFAFFAWFGEARPTWYTAVPSMHQAILPFARRHQPAIAESRLRLIRSSSATLPGAVMPALEAAFGVPVIEAYGMTEAAHQITANPLPPRARRAGSVGVAAGPEIAVLAEDGAMAPPGQVGEVAIRGRNVTAGYENNPTANAQSFTGGWFRTGDQGVLGADGYLRLTGRLKEQINRGGEKIAPLEVDTVLMDHPAVAQCLTFALPHSTLGEAVAAAIVLHEGAAVTDHALRAFAAGRLAAFKVPRRIIFMADLPKGATGKLQRIGLAQRLGLS